MNRIGRHESGHKRGGTIVRSSLWGALTIAVVAVGAPTCWLETPPGLWRCNETNNCADVPTTVCRVEENRCTCTVCGHVFCPEHNKCIPIEDCYSDERPWDCDDESGGGGGSGGGDGNGGSGGDGGGNGSGS
jgi:uncharacterized membrane protein YgcG